ncbi:MAG: alpha/beta hydrolase [Gordonia amarae]
MSSTDDAAAVTAPPEAGTSGAPALTWLPDRYLDRYEIATIPLGPDPDDEGPISATLIRRTAPDAGCRGAVLHVHGFTDYFFQQPLADFFHARGYAFYALDLRKCGRSLRDNQTPHFTTDLSRYREELTLALRAVLGEVGTGAGIIVGGHSTGGLTTSLWLDELRRDAPELHSRIEGAVLNSPWLDLQGDAVLRTYPVTLVIKAVAKVKPKQVLPQEISMAYGHSLHESAHGEWSYDLNLKPMGGFPVTFGFIDAVRSGQRRLHHGIDVGVPTLVLRSNASLFTHAYSPEVDAADIVLDVRHMAQWSAHLGDRVRVVPITGARHDVFLSAKPARESAYRALGEWLAEVSRDPDAADATRTGVAR